MAKAPLTKAQKAKRRRYRGRQLRGAALLLLENGAEKAKDIINAAGPYPSIKEYLAMIDENCYKGEGVTYTGDGTVTLKYSN